MKWFASNNCYSVAAARDLVPWNDAFSRKLNVTRRRLPQQLWHELAAFGVSLSERHARFHARGRPMRLLYIFCIVAVSIVDLALASDTYPLARLPLFTWVVDYEPFWAPDGGHIVLISSRHGGMHVHVLDKDGSDHGAAMRQLTFGANEDDSPAWSPDGKSIAFVSVQEGVSQILVMNVDGSGVHPVTKGRAENIHPAWSIDSARILINTTAFAPAKPLEPDGRPIGDTTDDTMDLATVRPDGTDLQRLTTGGGYTYASYSPDGRFIVHRRAQGQSSQIFIMNADGSGDHNISGASVVDGWPAWSPDGQRVVFARQVEGNFQIFVMNRDGSGVRQLTGAAGRFTNPRWSPDGSTILCSRDLGSMTLVTFPAPPA
jgi:Tol biopolymer transport system component